MWGWGGSLRLVWLWMRIRKLGVPAKSPIETDERDLSRVKYDKPYEDIRRDAEIILRGLAKEELKILKAERIERGWSRPPYLFSLYRIRHHQPKIG